VWAVCAVLAWRTDVGRRAVVLLGTTTAVLLLSPSFFAHYVAYTGPWTALVLGIGAGEVLRRFRRPVLVAAGAAVLTALSVVPTLGESFAPASAPPRLGRIAAAAQRVDGCVRSDDPGLLAALDVLSRDLDRGCPLWPDVTGWTYDRPGFPTLSAKRPGSAAWQRFVSGYLLGGDAVIVNRPGTGLSPATLDRIETLPVLARSGGLTLRATR
jgi:alpha-1,2-mannosyltransferase